MMPKSFFSLFLGVGTNLDSYSIPFLIAVTARQSEKADGSV